MSLCHPSDWITFACTPLLSGFALQIRVICTDSNTNTNTYYNTFMNSWNFTGNTNINANTTAAVLNDLQYTYSKQHLYKSNTLRVCLVCCKLRPALLDFILGPRARRDDGTTLGIHIQIASNFSISPTGTPRCRCKYKYKWKYKKWIQIQIKIQTQVNSRFKLRLHLTFQYHHLIHVHYK